jgi:membrane-bound ClpP family serine protease
MLWKDLLCICVIVIGAILFLYGANYYNVVIGWTGFSLLIVGFFCRNSFQNVCAHEEKRRELETVECRIFFVKIV